MDFDDLDEVQGFALEAQLEEHIRNVGAPEVLKDWLSDHQLLTCSAFYEFIKATDEGEIRAELERRVALQLSPPSTSLKEQVQIRNVWRKCKVTCAADFTEIKEGDIELIALQEKAERERKAAERANKIAEDKGEKERKAEIRKQQLEADKAERQRRDAGKKAERDRKAEEERQRVIAEQEVKEAAEEENRLRDMAERKARLAELAAQRCRKEREKKVADWVRISEETVQSNHEHIAPGMLNNIEFPWSAEMLMEWGPDWLTKAFHTAGTMLPDNTVTTLKLDLANSVTTGNNGGKFFFEVTYAHDDGLDAKLFAKIPYPLSQKTISDRLSSSVKKQPQELYELNTYRTLEDTLPCKLPRYYFGDINNETTNWILITEQIRFDDPVPLEFGRPVKRDKAPLKPYRIEGPYDKCIDWTLRGEASEYYYQLVRMGAMIAGFYKAGKLGDVEALDRNFENWAKVPVESWGMHPGCSGEPTKQLHAKLSTADGFIFDAGKVLFPHYVRDKTFQPKFWTTLTTLNAYSAESMYWRHRDVNYIALTHNNMNVDNAYWWRDEGGKLDLGIFDWGNMGARSLGFKLWWWLYCGDHDVLTANIDGYLQCFIDTYHEYGGPQLDRKELKTQFMITAMEQMQGLCNAVPQIFRMCPRKSWSTIKDRYDPRIAENIHGKSTLRLYLHVMESIIRIIEEWRGAEVLQKFVMDLSAAAPGLAKDASVIWGDAGPPKGMLLKLQALEVDQVAAESLTPLREEGVFGPVSAEASKSETAQVMETGKQCARPQWVQRSLEKLRRRRAGEKCLPEEVSRLPRHAEGVLGILPGFRCTSKQKLLEKCVQNLPGHFSGMTFPHTSKQIEEFGAEWLTRAFHKFGTLPQDNRVKRLVTVEDLPMGDCRITSNTGPQVLLVVEFQEQDPDLHTELIAKLAWDPNGNHPGIPDRAVAALRHHTTGLMDAGLEVETAVLAEHLFPFRVPKLYFGDMNRETTNFILITERALPARRGRVTPMCSECQEVHSDPLAMLLSLVRTAAQLAAWDQCGRFDAIWGPITRYSPAEHLATVGVRQPIPLKHKQVCSNACGSMLDSAIDFAANVAKQLFSPEASNKSMLAKFRQDMVDMAPHFDDINLFISNSSDFVGLLNLHTNVDSAYLWCDEQGDLDAGVMDWGSFGARDCIVKSLLGCISCTDAKLLHQHEEDMLKLFSEEYAQYGGPHISWEDIELRYHLACPESAMDICQWIGRAVYQEVPRSDSRWKTMKSVQGDEPMGGWNVRRHVTACTNLLDLWPKKDYRRVFDDWLQGKGRPYVTPYC